MKQQRRPLVPLDRAEVEFSAVRARGAGGQNVNKVSNAAHLRFDVGASSLPEAVKQRLLATPDQRLSRDGILVVKSQTHRSLPRNQADALARLQALVDAAATPETPRVATKPTRASQQRRLEGKARHGALKAARGRVSD